MKYKIVCPACGQEYVVSTDRPPKCCQECGHHGVAVFGNGHRHRPTAEELMGELDELLPQMEEAYEAYLAMSVRWHDLKSKLWYQKSKGAITQEEYDRYTGVRCGRAKKSQSDRLKDCRRERRQEGVRHG